MAVQLMRLYFKTDVLVDENFYSKLHKIFIVYSVLEFPDYVEIIIQRPYNKNKTDVVLKLIENKIATPLSLNHVVLNNRTKSNINYTDFEDNIISRFRKKLNDEV